MIQTAVRPFTDAEREEVESQLLEAVGGTTYRLHDIFSNALTFAYLGALCGVALGFLLSRFGIATVWAVGAGVVSTLCGFVVGIFDGIKWQNTLAEMRKRGAANIAKRLQRNQIEEILVTASGVAHVIDLDEGEENGFFFEIGDNRVMFLREETIWSFLEDVEWRKRNKDLLPPSAFRIAWYPDAVGQIVRYEPLGPPRTASRTIGAVGFGEEYFELVDGKIIEDVRLATLETGFPYLSVVDDEP